MSPAPSVAARPLESRPSRWNAASAQPIPSSGTSSAPTPHTRHSCEPTRWPQLPVMGSRSSVSPRNSPTTRAPIPISSWRAFAFM